MSCVLFCANPDSVEAGSRREWERGTVGEVSKVTYVVVCGAPPASRVGEFVGGAMSRGWATVVIASPDALPFVDQAGLEKASGYPVRSRWRRPDEPESVPDADAVVVAPATFNTINKWVTGIADTVAAATLCEYLGRSVPMIAAPNVNRELARHPTFRANLGVLAQWGVMVLFDENAPPDSRMASWERIADELERAIARPRKPI